MGHLRLTILHVITPLTESPVDRNKEKSLSLSDAIRGYQVNDLRIYHHTFFIKILKK